MHRTVSPDVGPTDGVAAAAAGRLDEGTYRRRWWALLVLSASLVLIGMDNTVLNVALPPIARELGASGSQLQWIVDAYVLVFAGLLLTMGAVGDRFGRKRALNAGLAVFVAGSVAAAAEMILADVAQGDASAWSALSCAECYT